MDAGDRKYIGCAYDAGGTPALRNDAPVAISPPAGEK
jgi:hypothetical protein